MRAKKRGKQMSGGAKLVASGKKAILLGVTINDWELLKAAAKEERRPITQFVLHYAMLAARGSDAARYYIPD